jgi:hypothetical protein
MVMFFWARIWGVVKSPTLAGIVQKAYPRQAIFGAVVDQNMGVAVAFRRNHGNRRIELQGGHY